MAKKEKEMPKEQVITLFDKEYKESELSDEQKVMINHVADLDRKIGSSEFNLQQLRFGKQAFLDALKVSIEKEDSEEKEMPKETEITLFDKTYKESELSDEQKAMINHVADLDRKIGSSEFNLQQLRFGKQAFVDALKISLEKNEEEE